MVAFILQVKSLFVVIAMASVALAGCVADSPQESDAGQARGAGVLEFDAMGLPVPILWCAGGDNATACNQEMTPDKDRQGNEVTIAVNPTDPKNIVGGSKDYYPPDAGECVWDGVYVTHDGGVTYEDRSFDGSPWRLLQDPSSFTPNYASQFWCTTDPVVYFNTEGSLYYLLMAYQADRVTGSKTCEEECPNGALNDWAFNRATQIVAVSDDGGDTFHTFTPVLEGSFPVNFHDKGWIAASHNGVIHVMWLAFFVPGNQYCRSTDGGQTFVCSQVMAVTGLGSGQGSFVEVGTGGEVYALWTSGGGIQLRRSMDYGETWDDQQQILERNNAGMPGLSARDRRGGFPMLATDRSADSPNSDALYVAWQDACSSAVWEPACDGRPNIYFSSSFDKGDTWSSPIRINDDRDADGQFSAENYQIFPAISVSPGGVIDVSWMDTRLNQTAVLREGMGGSADLIGQEHLKFDQYHTYSVDGGKTWSQNFRVRDVADGGWDPQYSHHQNAMIFIGDYNDIDSSWGAAHPVWPDTRSEEVVDVYTAVVQRPLFADGWGDEAKAAMIEQLIADGVIAADHPFIDY
jgi:hypothetical protein